MQKERKESSGRGLKSVGEDQDKMLRQLDSKLIALASTSSGALSRKTIEEIERTIDEYYRRWKA